MKTWRFWYGTAMTALILSALVMVGMDTASFWKGITHALAQSYGYALLIQFAIYGGFSVLERVLPAAGPRKPVRGYLLNLQVILLGIAAGTVFGGLSGALVTTIGDRLGLGF